MLRDCFYTTIKKLPHLFLSKPDSVINQLDVNLVFSILTVVKYNFALIHTPIVPQLTITIMNRVLIKTFSIDELNETVHFFDFGFQIFCDANDSVEKSVQKCDKVLETIKISHNFERQ